MATITLHTTDKDRELLQAMIGSDEWNYTAENRLNILQEALLRQFLDGGLAAQAMATPAPYFAMHTSHPNCTCTMTYETIDGELVEVDVSHELLAEDSPIPVQDIRMTPVLRRQNLIIKHALASARGQFCIIFAAGDGGAAARATDGEYVWPRRPIRTVTLLAYVYDLEGCVSTHVVERVRLDHMDNLRGNIEQGQTPFTYPSITEWLEGLTRDIDRHFIETARLRKRKLSQLAGGAECDVIKWLQTHRTPADTLSSLTDAGITIVMSHTEPWVMSRYHPDHKMALGMAFVAICPVGQGAQAISVLNEMGYRTKMLKLGKPDIPAIVGLDERLTAAQDDTRYRRDMQKVGRHRLVEDDGLPEIEI